MINYKDVKQNLENNGYFIIKNFIKKNDIDDNFVEYLKNKPKFVDGVIHGIDNKFYKNIDQKIANLSKQIRSKNLDISDNKFSYSSIKIKKTTSKKFKLIKPFNIYKDPKIMPGGVLNWHIDHFTYYFHDDHKNYLICYLPILKKKKEFSNVAIISYSQLKRFDYSTYKKIKNRGAMRFRKVEKDTKPWFDMRFKTNAKVGDWYALDDYSDDSQGWKIKVDLEKIKVVPKLSKYDLLIMKADVIHKTNDAKIDRIAIRCDILPNNAKYEHSYLGFIKICLKYFFRSNKSKYNLKNYIKEFIKNKF